MPMRSVLRPCFRRSLHALSCEQREQIFALWFGLVIRRYVEYDGSRDFISPNVWIHQVILFYIIILRFCNILR